MHKSFRYFPAIIFCLLLAAFGFGAAAHAATLFMYPKEQEVVPGQEFSIDVRVDAKTDKINVVKGLVRYSKDLLEVVDVTSRGSFLSLWMVNPKNDAANGTITFSGGIPGGTYVIGGKAATITFRAKTQGEALITADLSQSGVYLHDGKGTPAPLAAEAGTAYVVEEVSNPLNVISATHPDENTWYTSRTFKASWQIRESALYSYVLSRSPLEVPDSVPEDFSGEAVFDAVQDGANYFIVREKTREGTWKIVARRKVLVDATPPTPIQWATGQDIAAYEGKWFLAFSSTDVASGIARFDVIEDNVLHSGVTSPYIFSDQTQKSTLEIIVYDVAGNSTVALIRELQDDSFGFQWIALGVALAVLVLGGIVLVWKRRKRKQNHTEAL